jgi:hypothetical protein
MRKYTGSIMTKIARSYRLDDDCIKIIQRVQSENGTTETGALEKIICDQASIGKSTKAPDANGSPQDRDQSISNYLQMRKEGKKRLDIEIDMKLPRGKEEEYSAFFDQLVECDFSNEIRDEKGKTGKRCRRQQIPCFLARTRASKNKAVS